MKSFEQAKKKIMGARTILISGHLNPDGDSIGSILSLGLGLERMGKRVYTVSYDGVPKRYRILPGARRIAKRTDKIPDLAIALDCGTSKLLGPTFELFKKAGSILEIDHHQFRTPFGDASLIDNKAAAVGELVYLLLKDLGVEITKDIAQNILTSIIVETSSFRLPNIRHLTFEICAQLMKKDVNFYKLVDTVFWSKSKEASTLMGLCLSRCKFSDNGKLAWSIVRRGDFKAVGGKDEDVDPVVDEIRAVKDVRIALLFRERKNNLLRVSLRSKGKINIASIAEKYGGGGHFDSAGCYIPHKERYIKSVLRSARALL
ncbi:MAG: bifunctional oligoribonuclease/PAP phosphatase NrnA [Candidatus Omnitrophica bacterium]|nr:bifunctional oligoribonuclease/PAP phosphatase NrnA [Candidatus Omnitrophota bacterium]